MSESVQENPKMPQLSAEESAFKKQQEEADEIHREAKAKIIAQEKEDRKDRAKSRMAKKPMAGILGKTTNHSKYQGKVHDKVNAKNIVKLVLFIGLFLGVAGASMAQNCGQTRFTCTPTWTSVFTNTPTKTTTPVPTNTATVTPVPFTATPSQTPGATREALYEDATSGKIFPAVSAFSANDWLFGTTTYTESEFNSWGTFWNPNGMMLGNANSNLGSSGFVGVDQLGRPYLSASAGLTIEMESTTNFNNQLIVGVSSIKSTTCAAVTYSVGLTPTPGASGSLTIFNGLATPVATIVVSNGIITGI